MLRAWPGWHRCCPTSTNKLAADNSSNTNGLVTFAPYCRRSGILLRHRGGQKRAMYDININRKMKTNLCVFSARSTRKHFACACMPVLRRRKFLPHNRNSALIFRLLAVHFWVILIRPPAALFQVVMLIFSHTVVATAFHLFYFFIIWAVLCGGGAVTFALPGPSGSNFAPKIMGRIPQMRILFCRDSGPKRLAWRSK